MSICQDLYKHAKQIIPGGTQLLSKRPENAAPGQWPTYFTKAKGCEVWDLDGNHYYDMTTNGIGSCLLGYANPEVSEAVIERVKNGAMSTLNPPEEVYLADKLCEIHPWAQSVRFARTGGEIAAVAVRIARATTKRDIIVISGYHGWSDWYLAANLGDTTALNGIHLPGLQPDGVPFALKGTSLTFRYGDVEAFDKIIENYGDRIAAVIMEPARNLTPPEGFLEHIRDEIHRVGGLLIFDEITIGWRLGFGGSHLKFGVNPDMAIFAKAMGNGHPIAAVIGTKEAMDGAQTSFISSTYWTESVGPTAALKTIEVMEKSKVWEHVEYIGKTIQNDWMTLAEKHGIDINCSGYACLAHFGFNDYPAELGTLYTVLMLKEGFLAGTGIYPTLAHNDEILAKYRIAIDKVFGIIADLLKKGGKEAIVEAIGGPVRHSGFARLID